MIATDADRIADYVNSFNQMWSTLVQLFLCFVILCKEFGITALGALFIIILLIPITLLAYKLTTDSQNNIFVCKDERLKILSEMLSNVKIIKFFSWEDKIKKFVLKMRNEELVHLEKRLDYLILLVFAYSATPFLVCISINFIQIYLFVAKNNF